MGKGRSKTLERGLETLGVQAGLSLAAARALAAVGATAIDAGFAVDRQLLSSIQDAPALVWLATDAGLAAVTIHSGAQRTDDGSRPLADATLVPWGDVAAINVTADVAEESAGVVTTLTLSIGHPATRALCAATPTDEIGYRDLQALIREVMRRTKLAGRTGVPGTAIAV